MRIPGPVDRPPRNRELERLVIDVLRGTPKLQGEAGPDAQARAEGWQVYADWLLSLGEPVGEWLAASLRVDEAGAGDAVAPIRAQLDGIARACSFRLVDPALADLSEVPELARIADLTWERGFITVAELRTRAFRAWDSELLEHTPDHLLEVILASPSACMLHTLRVDALGFAAVGARHPSVAALLASLAEPLAARELELGDGTDSVTLGLLDARALARVPELARLVVISDELGRGRGLVARALAPLLVSPESAEGSVPRLRELDLRLRGAGDLVVEALLGSDRLATLRCLQIGHVGEAGAARILAERDRFASLDRFALVDARIEPGTAAALTELGASVRAR
jgi:hypothetical protein